MTSETIFIGVLLVLQSFWVVTWPVYDNFEFGAKIGQKWSKMAQNTENGLDVWKNNIRNNLHQISARLAIVLSGHMTSIQQFWVWGKKRPKVAKSGQNGWKRPQVTENDWNWLIWCCHSSCRPILSACANSIQQWGWTGQKSQVWHRENFLWKAATDHIWILGYVFFLKNDVFSWPIFGYFGPIFAVFGPFFAELSKFVPNLTILMQKK